MSQSLFTDLYELTMMAGYWRTGHAEDTATFDLFHRHAPRGVDLVVAAGLEPTLEWLEQLGFSDDDLLYLDSLDLFPDGFLDWLGDLRFTGEVWAMPEGTPVLPHEPILRVTAPLAQGQLVETALLNMVSYSSLVASTASQLVAVARGTPILEFGARRAHGPDGARTGSRAAYLGGCAATSNVVAAADYGVPPSGTQAHAWIMAFPDELTAFRAYADTFPHQTVLLVDTYDTVRSGVPNAITVGHELAASGHRLRGIRLDSGDLDALSRQARQMLDEAGLSDVQVLVSGDLDVARVRELVEADAPIDGFGVGTSLLTAREDPAFSGVYKLAEVEGRPALKVSGEPTKTTDPGRKQVWRTPEGDVLGLAHEDLAGTPLLEQVMAGGRRLRPAPDLAEQRARCLDRVAELRPHPERWTLRRSPELKALRRELLATHGHAEGA